jgi:hypothetical protein
LNKHFAYILLALAALGASILACSPPIPRATFADMTPYVPTTPAPQETQQLSPTDTPEATTEETSPPTLTDTPSPTATDTPTPAPTDTPLPTATDTPLPPPPTVAPEPTATPTPEATVAPLDFEPPQYVDSWEKKGSTNKVVLRVNIVGGEPPFTVSHGPTVQGTTMDRVFFIEFEWSSCKSAMVQSITVESSDGQKVKKDYYIPVANMPWCAP